MALGLSTGGDGGEIRPYISFDAKAGRLFRVDRVQGSDGNYATEKHEITDRAQFIADLANIRVGWINYTAQGPVRKLVVLGKEPIPARPEEKNSEGKPAYKQGFEIDLLLNKDSGGGPARVLGSSAACVIDAMDEIHDAYSASAEAKAGKLPVLKIASVSPVKSKQSTNYKPTFQIVSWVDRPAALAFEESIRAANSAPPATGSTVASPPVPQPAASASDFG
jgi:hypothetical protein